MLSELKSSLKQEKEVNEMLKDLLAKYSTTMEDLTAKGLVFSEIAEEELEAKIAETLGVEVIVEAQEPEVVEPTNVEPEVVEPEVVEPEAQEPEVVEPVVEPEVVEPEAVEPTVDVEALQNRIAELEGQLETANETIQGLEAFKLNVEKTEHEGKVQKMFNDFQLTTEDVEGIDIHKFSLEEIEDKCYAIIGRKMANKQFSKKEDGNVRLPLNNEPKEESSKSNSRYGDLFEKYNK
jgi:hypothetical protein